MEAKVSQLFISLIGLLPKFRIFFRPVRQRFGSGRSPDLTPRELSIGSFQYRRSRQCLKIETPLRSTGKGPLLEKPSLRHFQGDSGAIASCTPPSLGVLTDGIWCGEGHRGYRRRDPMLLLVRLALTLSSEIENSTGKWRRTSLACWGGCGWCAFCPQNPRGEISCTCFFLFFFGRHLSWRWQGFVLYPLFPPFVYLFHLVFFTCLVGFGCVPIAKL